MLFIQHLAPTNPGLSSSGLVPFDGLLFCEFRSKRAETTQHLQGCDCRVPLVFVSWKDGFFLGLGDTQNWEKLKLFQEGFADVSWCRDCRVLWICDFTANWFSCGTYRSVKHGSVLETWINRSRDPENKSPFFGKEQGYLILLGVACPKFHCF